MTEKSSELSLQQIQDAVDGWISQWEEGYWSPLANLARLVEEVGELSREINDQHGEKPKKSSEEEGRIGSELADILFVLVCIANSLDVDLTEEFEGVLEKYDIRDADRWTRKEDA
ncbi:nucleotide pyrophosphohydrolase [Persicimonas caeni]|uniref:Nucleotide pyrophosphohydrolase n=1 Tax=Persicimonas caeni TaxID=2292766 RepID=A0A4Y6Q1C8_PERCE|nr:nucleotide pyrophosphohydrolase [Persicimonas caeni]QDG54376.1 nucleotide pyrophosphohydrolase [Persicimonas caeni]QED35597.1 nucleotide pyrophosphohydrolase [Persicimonas caeni]